MKKLTLIRHAKSDWTDPVVKDFDRPLNSRGHRVAPKMGVKLHEMGFAPALLVSSPAVRARATTEYLIEQLKYDLTEVRFDDELYEASVRILLSMVNQLSDDLGHVAFVGHNPTLTYLTEYLTGDEVGDLPTCAVVQMDFEVDTWEAVSKDTGTIASYIYPKRFDF